MRSIADPYPVSGPTGVAVRTRLKHLTAQDEKVLRLVGAHLGSLAAADLKARCADGLDHDSASWAERKRALTPESSSRWAGSITKATHDQWALARRGQVAHLRSLEAGIATIRHRLSLPVGAKGIKKKPGGYRSRQEWHAKSRRLATLQDRLATVRADFEAGKVSVVRGGKHVARHRHHLDAVQLTEPSWRERWQAARWFFQADGESGKRFGNETIRVTPDGEVSIKLPAPLKEWANAPHGRYRLSGTAVFVHRGREWASRVAANRSVAYRVHLDVDRGRWYLTASWQIAEPSQIPLRSALAQGVIGVDMNADHLAAWRLDTHGNPVGAPRRFDYRLSGSASHRDAQVRHALTRLLRWARECGVRAIAVEDLDFTDSKTRERHGRRKRFRQLISGMPTGRLRTRLLSMCAEAGIGVIAVDPAYTSRWGAQHWQRPLTGRKRRTSRHAAAAVAIGRRALGHAIRCRMAPPPHHRSDGAGHRTVQTGPRGPGREGDRPRASGPRTRSDGAGRGPNAVDQSAQDRSGCSAEHVQLILGL
ncbi:IS200/IS605 family accessory protein TnpB-related protein [Nocardiopsis sp. NPDC006832]|uniref:IS200/IS605 family accessory protein TnpB-related protein n=1 Tax=Nocardiopsis sp. NPDC006832 TaxID=3157188 RepID=UPI0033C34897